VIRKETHKSKQQHGEDGYFLALSGMDTSAAILIIIVGTDGSYRTDDRLCLLCTSHFAVSTRPHRPHNNSNNNSNNHNLSQRQETKGYEKQESLPQGQSSVLFRRLWQGFGKMGRL
jgi:hypothetical protein